MEEIREKPPLKIESTNGTISIEGSQINFVQLTEEFYNQMNNSIVPIAVINIKNFIVDASELSASVQKFSTSIVKIYLNNVTLIGQFHRVYLPNLRDFYLNQIVNAERFETYQEKDYVHSVLFFDIMENELWEMKDVSNLGVNIVFNVNGFKFINVNRNSSTGKRELTLNVPYCNEILENSKSPYEILSIATCSIAKKSIPNNLEYLNFFEVVINDGNISEILQGKAQLQYLFLDLVNTTIDISHIPKSLNSLSLSTIVLTYKENNSNEVFNNLHSLSLGFISMLDEIYDDFEKLFPHLDHVAAFGFQSANYPLLESCYKAQVSWVLVEEFNHNAKTKNETNLQNLLKNIGITSSDVNFLVTLPKYSDSLVAFPLTNLQEHDYRYMFLGWYKFLSFEAYRNADKYVIDFSN